MNALEIVTLVNMLLRAGVDLKATLDAISGEITPEDVRMSSDDAQKEVDKLNDWVKSQE